MTLHSLKTVQPYFDDALSGRKTFEVRRNDRGFRVGDGLMLTEHPGERCLFATVAYILAGEEFGIRPGYVVLGFERPAQLAPEPKP